MRDDEGSLFLTDDEGNEIEFRELGRIDLDGREYVFLEDPEDEGSVLVFRAEDDSGEEVLSPVEDEDECENAFMMFQAEADDYEIGPAV